MQYNLKFLLAAAHYGKHKNIKKYIRFKLKLQAKKFLHIIQVSSYITCS